VSRIVFFYVPKLSSVEDPTESLSISSCYTSLLGLVTTLMLDGKPYLKYVVIPISDTRYRAEFSKHTAYCLV
jgi:hypothetical protein